MVPKYIQIAYNEQSGTLDPAIVREVHEEQTIYLGVNFHYHRGSQLLLNYIHHCSPRSIDQLCEWISEDTEIRIPTT